MKAIITTEDADQRSSVLRRLSMSADAGAVEVWRARPSAPECTTPESWPAAFYPAERGATAWRLLTLPPEPPDAAGDPETVSEAFFSGLGIPECRVDTRRHPTMHRTPTTDYAVLLSGELTLLLDDDEVELRPHDLVVQRHANHAWVNRGSDPAVLLVVLVGDGAA